MGDSVKDQDAAVKAIQFYEEHPENFIEEVIGVKLDKWQIEACRDLVKNHYLAIRSGSGVGKTFLLASLLLWFISTKPYAKIPATAPSKHQLYDLLWSECYKWITKSPYLTSLLDWSSSKISVKGFGPTWYAVARTASISPEGDVAEGLQGFHGDEGLLFIIDEASGVDDTVFPAMEGALTGENAFCILAGNPTRLSGYFYDVFHRSTLGKKYKKIHISSEDSPRVSRQWVEMMEERYGRTHPLFRIKVLGEFPIASDDLLISPAVLDAMLNSSKDTQVSPMMPIEIGVDIGRTSAATTLFARQGCNVLEGVQKQRHGGVDDAVETANWIMEYIHAYKPSVVRIDANGIGGPICDILEPMYPKLIIRVIGQARSTEPEIYLNLRAEGYWKMSNLLPKLWCANWPQRLVVELSDIRKRYSTNGKLHVETKEEMKARALRSPDWADALMYSYLSEADELARHGMIETHFHEDFIEINKELVGASPWRDASMGDDYRYKWKIR